MDDLFVHLKCLEESLLDPRVRSSVAALETLLSPQFREIGMSGRIYDYSAVVDALLTEEPVASRELNDFQMTMLSNVMALVIYRATRKLANGVEIHSQRSSIWCKEGSENWQMLFHQGTLLR